MRSYTQRSDVDRKPPSAENLLTAEKSRLNIISEIFFKTFSFFALIVTSISYATMTSDKPAYSTQVTTCYF